MDTERLKANRTTVRHRSVWYRVRVRLGSDEWRALNVRRSLPVLYIVDSSTKSNKAYELRACVYILHMYSRALRTYTHNGKERIAERWKWGKIPSNATRVRDISNSILFILRSRSSARCHRICITLYSLYTEYEFSVFTDAECCVCVLWVHHRLTAACMYSFRCSLVHWTLAEFFCVQLISIHISHQYFSHSLFSFDSSHSRFSIICVCVCKLASALVAVVVSSIDSRRLTLNSLVLLLVLFW